MGDLNDEYFKDITRVVPKFYLKPVVTNPSDVKGTADVISRNDSHSDEVFPSYPDWYIRPQRDVYKGGHFNRNESKSQKGTDVYDSLVDKLINDHGWKLEDFEILKNKAEAIINTNNGFEYKDNIEIEEELCDSLKTTRISIAPDYYIEGRQARFSPANEENVQGTFQNNYDTFQKHPKIHSETKGRVSYRSAQRDVTEFDTLHIDKSYRTTFKSMESYLGLFQRSLANNYEKQMVKTNSNLPQGLPKESLEYKSEKCWDSVQNISIGLNNRCNCKTYDEFENNQNWTESVKSKIKIPAQSSYQNNETCKEVGLNKNTEDYTVDKCSEILSGAKDLTNATSIDMSKNVMNSPITNLHDREEYIPSCRQHNYNNTIPSKSISEVYHRSNSHLTINNNPCLKPTITNTVYTRRRKLRSHNWQRSPTKNMSITRRTHKIENTVTSASPEINCGKLPNQELDIKKTDSQLDQINILTRERLYQIIDILKQSNDKAIALNNYDNLKSNKNGIQTNASSVLPFEPNSIHHTNEEALQKYSIINEINSNLKMKTVNLNGPALLASLAKRISQTFAKIVGRETPRPPVRLLQSSVSPLLISEVSSVPVGDENNITIEKSIPSPLEYPPESTNNELTTFKSNSNTVSSSNELTSKKKTLASEFQELELDEWALKYQLLSYIQQRKENVKSNWNEMSQTKTITNKMQVPKVQRKYKNDNWKESQIHPSTQSDSYLYKEEIQNPFLNQRKQFPGIKAVSLTKKYKPSDQMFKLGRYQHRNSDRDPPYVKSQIKYPIKHQISQINDNNGYLFKN